MTDAECGDGKAIRLLAVTAFLHVKSVPLFYYANKDAYSLNECVFDMMQQGRILFLLRCTSCGV